MTNQPKDADDRGAPQPTPDPQPSDPRREPANSTVDDWFGQSVDRDAELADELVEEADGDMEEAAAEFEDVATGAERQAERRSGRSPGV